MIDQLRKDTEQILNVSDRIIFDEAQKMPQLFYAIKQNVDQHPEKRFILSGSANMLLMSKITESLAGRAEFIELYPKNFF